MAVWFGFPGFGLVWFGLKLIILDGVFDSEEKVAQNDRLSFQQSECLTQPNLT